MLSKTLCPCSNVQVQCPKQPVLSAESFAATKGEAVSCRICQACRPCPWPCKLISVTQLQDQKPPANVLNQNKIVKWQDKSSLGMMAGTAAAAGCLLAMPAFAETAAQGVEEVAKQIASSDSAFGMPSLSRIKSSLVVR